MEEKTKQEKNDESRKSMMSIIRSRKIRRRCMMSRRRCMMSRRRSRRIRRITAWPTREGGGKPTHPISPPCQNLLPY